MREKEEMREREERKPCVEIRVWLNSNKSSVGHVALRTYYENDDGNIVQEGIYASFWPGKKALTLKDVPNCKEGLRCDRHKDHIHTKNQDDIGYTTNPTNIIKLYTLDITKIEQKFREFTEGNFRWELLGSLLVFENDDSKNCAGLCFSLLEAGGLFSKLGYQNNERGTHYLPGKGFIGGVSGFAAFTMILVGGAVGGALTIEMGPAAIAGCVVGSFAAWYLLTIGLENVIKKLVTPREILKFGQKISQVESVLLSQDLVGMEQKISTEILRLRNTKTILFFEDTDALNKSTHLEAALNRAKQNTGLVNVAEFLLYSYEGMSSIMAEANTLRLFSSLSRPTTTFRNLIGNYSFEESENSSLEFSI